MGQLAMEDCTPSESRCGAAWSSRSMSVRGGAAQSPRAGSPKVAAATDVVVRPWTHAVSAVVLPPARPQLRRCSFTRLVSRRPWRGYQVLTRSASAGAVPRARKRVPGIPEATCTVLRTCRCTAPPSRSLRGWWVRNRCSSVLCRGQWGAAAATWSARENGPLAV